MSQYAGLDDAGLDDDWCSGAVGLEVDSLSLSEGFQRISFQGSFYFVLQYRGLSKIAKCLLDLYIIALSVEELCTIIRRCQTNRCPLKGSCNMDRQCHSSLRTLFSPEENQVALPSPTQPSVDCIWIQGHQFLSYDLSLNHVSHPQTWDQGQGPGA